ncbi:MAG: tRNA uridine(34) 5-carboxymethylaminomethyl modification radical SAM/GNAT enzyme Elp3 [Methanomassiliicoccales archaeon]|nr:MAG: tRNA uridine(34) 5-carboxymethylaminomethyl modification radical SAM/GNAT enzyme Elp3 [Methanomassiliicoccales archaeon]
MAFYEDIIDQIRSGEIRTKEEIHRAKVKLCKKHGLSYLPSDVDILEHASPDIYHEIEPFLRLKPVRTTSGVAVVAVMTSPSDCPHGRCIYCPGGKEFGTAQSYTGHEPAAMRAGSHDFDPYEQTKSRIEQLNTIGHLTDKIDLIIMGGTFTARDKDYQEWFVKRCFDAMNKTDSASIVDAHGLNEFAPSRCIGMTIETRPDWCKKEHIDEILRLGGTRVELGIQTTYDDVLKGVKRGHTVLDSISATRLAKDAGLKVCYHMMPGLPGSNFKRDLASFKALFENPDFMPDMLKIYPTLVVEGTELKNIWEKQGYKPYDTEKNAELIAEIKGFLPEWVRIQRIQRDIPVKLILDGVDKSNLRQIVQKKLKNKGQKCECIRCREVGISSLKGLEPDVESIALKRKEYEASLGREYFLSYEDFKGVLIAYARLRKPSEKAHREEVKSRPCMILRELKVAGEMVPIGTINPKKWQHRGYGQNLLQECETIASHEGAERLLVTSGVGVRDYYRKLGYEREGPFMVKNIF